MDRRTRYSPEVRERAVRMVFDHEAEYSSQWSAMVSISQKFGCTAETLRRWVRQAETDRGRRAGLSTAERERLKELERENRELRRANEILHVADRGRRIRTTVPAAPPASIRDRVNRTFAVSRPNALWVADLSYIATWRGLVYVAFVIDAFARRIVGWRVSNSLRTDLALDALEQALYDRRVEPAQSLVHHSDRGVQYLSIRYTERLAEAGIEPSVGRVGNSYDNALAETIIGLYKTEVIRRRGPWRHLEAVELATLEWVEWFNHRRLFEPIGDLTPVEKEEISYQNQEWAKVA